MVISWFRKSIGGQALFDGFAWVFALVLAGILRFEFDLDRMIVTNYLVLGIALGSLHWLIGKLSGLYSSRFVTGSFDELLNLALVTFLTSVPAVVVSLIWGPAWGLPRSAVFIAAPIFVLLSGLVRSTRRLRTRFVAGSLSQKRTIIYGAGAMAEALIAQLLTDSQRKYIPVALLDDDPSKRNRWISGVKMRGSLDRLPQVARSLAANALIVAIPQANSELLQKVKDVASSIGLEVIILPSFSEILENGQGKFQLSELGIEDLIGRRAVSIDSETVGGYLEGKIVLVTGAGGSIGVELCRQVARYNPSRLIFLDRDETGLQLAQLAVTGSGLLDGSDIVLADIRDEMVIEEAFQLTKPDVVFHAAALKHLPALERFPREAWKTNVLGTAHVLSAADRAGVSHFVNISTDKAADPTSFLGKSKKLAEELTSWYSTKGIGHFHSVRFGNVLGSRGSLVPTLQYLIEKGGPISITDPEATRFFMTIPEACQLVLQAGSEIARNSILILDMGKPVKILDIANRMIEMSGKRVELIFSGLRAGEKLHEDLFSQHESLQPSSHPLIWKVSSPGLDPRNLDSHQKGFLNEGRL